MGDVGIVNRVHVLANPMHAAGVVEGVGRAAMTVFKATSWLGRLPWGRRLYILCARHGLLLHLEVTYT